MSTVGSVLNSRYRLEQKIGDGGFANVFLATDLELGRKVAVKVLEQSWIKDNELLTRFRNEARAIAALEHPNILLIHDYGITRGAPYIVMPYISGGTLADRMKQGPFTFDEIGVYLDQIGSALDYAHERGIVHRDVKPSNLLIRPNGQLVLMDFGLAKLLDNAELAAQTAIVGTVAYMAPEQLQGFVSTASDIYMLGIILYQMLAGKLPYEGNTTRLFLEHLHSTPGSLRNLPTMRSVPPSVVQALDQVLLKVLAKSPADRYPSCQALTSAYYQALNADPKRAARVQSRNNHLDQRNLNETLIDKLPIVPSPPAKVEVKPGVQSSETSEDATQVAPEPVQRKKVLLKPARLVVTTEPDNGYRTTFDLVGETLTLGRASDNNLYLPLPTVSRHHAVLNQISSDSQEPSYKIVQCKSINPLCFQGKEIAEKLLEHGDTIEIGKRGYAKYIVKLMYHAPEYGFA